MLSVLNCSLLFNMTNRERKSMIEQWVIEINPKLSFVQPMPDVGQGMPSSCSFSRRVRHKMHVLPAIGTDGAVPFRCVLCQ